MKRKKFSAAHYVYIRKYRTRKILLLATQILFLVACLLLWEVLANYEIINSFFFSSPSRIGKTLAEMYKSLKKL